MSTGKALLWAAGIVVLSAILLTGTTGVPTSDRLVGGSAIMFVVAFAAFKIAK